MSSNKKEYLSPIRSFDFYLVGFHALAKKLKLENELVELYAVLKRALEPEVISILKETYYEALVVTDLNKKIVWTNNGFREMTGYAKRYAMGRTPVFLQGKNTSQEVKSEIRQLLLEKRRFATALTNYRKNGEEYLCHIDVIPLHDQTHTVTHFLAMEKELEVA